jgi:hypothetical protein
MNGRISQGCGVERGFETRSREWRQFFAGLKHEIGLSTARHCTGLERPLGRLLHIRSSVGGVRTERGLNEHFGRNEIETGSNYLGYCFDV